MKGSDRVPLHEQIREALRQDIRVNHKPGDQLPTEMELTERYRVSRSTIRRAVLDLVDEGVLYRKRGRGTFVAEPRSQRKIPTQVIGFLGPPLSDAYASKLLIGIQSVARAAGYELVYRCSNNCPEIEKSDLMELRSLVGGLIVFPSDGAQPDPFRALVASGVPVVLVDRYFQMCRFDEVTSDNIGGSAQLTKHLIQQGYNNVGFVSSSSLNISSVRDRFLGYRRALKDADKSISAPLVYKCDTSIPGGFTGFLEKYLAAYIEEHRLDAIVAANDYTAIEIFKCLVEWGIKVPDQLGLVGFDDISSAKHLAVPLTTAAQMEEEIGREAAKLLLDRINGSLTTQYERRVLPVKLRFRKSSSRKNCDVYSQEVESGIIS